MTTPSPWHWDDLFEGGTHIQAQSLLGPEDTPVIKMGSPYEGWSESDEVILSISKEDAALILSAPVLKEQNDALIKALEDLLNDFDEPDREKVGSYRRAKELMKDIEKDNSNDCQ